MFWENGWVVQQYRSRAEKISVEGVAKNQTISFRKKFLRLLISKAKDMTSKAFTFLSRQDIMDCTLACVSETNRIICICKFCFYPNFLNQIFLFKAQLVVISWIDYLISRQKHYEKNCICNIKSFGWSWKVLIIFFWKKLANRADFSYF